jgi:large subunit ribosomal protein L21
VGTCLCGAFRATRRLTQADSSTSEPSFRAGVLTRPRPYGQAIEEEKIAMFAVVRTGGKQYRVAAGDKIVVEKMAGVAGDTVSLGDVLFASDGGEVKVTAEIIAQAKAEKIIVFKKRRRHNYRRKNGHRQQHTILKILAVGDVKAVEAAPKAAKAPKAVAAPVEAAPVAEAAPAKKPAAKKAAPKAAAAAE